MVHFLFFSKGCTGLDREITALIFVAKCQEWGPTKGYGVEACLTIDQMYEMKPIVGRNVSWHDGQYRHRQPQMLGQGHSILTINNRRTNPKTGRGGARDRSSNRDEPEGARLESHVVIQGLSLIIGQR